MTEKHLILGWVWSSVVATVVAVGAATVVLAESIVAVLAVAALEGLCLALIQRRLLRGVKPGLEVGWISATIIGAVVGRLVQFLADTGAPTQLAASWPEPAKYAGGFLTGMIVGALMALPQAILLRNRLAQPTLWLVARGLAWALTLMFLFAASGLFADAANKNILETIAIVGLLFAGAGALAGAIEGLSMAMLVAPRELVHPARAPELYNQHPSRFSGGIP